MKRFIFLGLFLASLGSVLFSSSVSANTNIPSDVFSSPIPVCDNFPDFISVMKNELNVVIDDNLAYVGFQDGGYSRYAYSTFQPTSTSPRPPIRLVDNDGTYTLYINNSTSYRYPTMWKTETTYSRGNQYSNPSLNCFSSYQNMTFHYCRSGVCAKIDESDYDKFVNLKNFTHKASEYEEFTSSIFEEFRECEAFDLACLVENFLIFIRNIFTLILKLPEFIVELFKFLFIPDQEFLATYFEDMKSYAVENSGFLKVPVTVFNSFVKMARDVTGNSGNSAQNLIIHLNMMLGNSFNCGLYDSNSPYKLPHDNVCSGDYLGSVSFFGKEFRINQSIYPIVDKFLVYIRIFLQGSIALMLLTVFYRRIQTYAGRSF